MTLAIRRWADAGNANGAAFVSSSVSLVKTLHHHSGFLPTRHFALVVLPPAQNLRWDRLNSLGRVYPLEYTVFDLGPALICHKLSGQPNASTPLTSLS